MAARTLPDVVLLAAGRSSRMGEPKGLVLVHGRPWIDLQLDTIEGAGSSAVVVLGFDRERYEAARTGLAGRARVVHNPDPDRGPFSSLQCGLAALPPGESAYVLPVDVPAPEVGVWARLSEALGPAIDAAVPTYEGRGGHPVLLSPRLVARLLGLPPASRLDLELAASTVARVPVGDARVRMNLNVPEDWGKLGLGG
jgi:molybdenum cofactor cytidylyltransferase